MELPRGFRGDGTPHLGTFHFLRALNLRKFLMLMEERLRLSSCFLLRGCGGKDTALSPCPHPATRASGSHPLPVPLTLIQGCSRHSAAVMRRLRHRGRRWGWGSGPPHVHRGDWEVGMGPVGTEKGRRWEWR